MSFDRCRQTPRWPRYDVIASQAIQVEIERTANRLPTLVRVELKDISRTGYQFKTPMPLEIQEAILLRLRAEDPANELALRGTVRWMRPADDGAWLVGCLTDSPLGWDSLGELFLNGILSPDGPQ